MSSSNQRKLKIAHVITRMIVGGAQENTLFSVIGHCRHGHEVVLITGPTSGPEGKLLQTPGLPPFEVIEIPEMVREISPLNDLKAYFRIKQLCRERGFDVVHTHCSKAGIIGRGAAWAAKVPAVVHTVHGQAFHPYQNALKNRLYKATERWAGARCHRIFSVAQAMIDQCVEAGIAPRERYQVVYSGMEMGPFLNAVPEPALRQQLGIPEKVKVVGAVGRLFPQKGYEFFVPMARQILDACPDTHFLIVGNGIMREELDRQIAEMKMTDHFHFAGLVPPDQVYRYVALMDLLVHLSLHEGLPRCVVQALACGKPAIGYDLDGTPEVIIPGKTGFLAPPESIEPVVEGAVKILTDSALATRLGENGRHQVADQFPWEKMVDILEDQYVKILTKK